MSNLVLGPKGEPIPPVQRQRVAALVDEHGERGALELLHISRQTLGRVLGGLPCYAGTHELVRVGLAGVDGGEPQP